MRRRIVWAPLALERVLEVGEYIGRDRAGEAGRWIDGLFTRVELLAESPAQGRVVPELGREEIREVVYKGYRVIYRLEPKRIVVLTVRHGRRQFEGKDAQSR